MTMQHTFINDNGVREQTVRYIRATVGVLIVIHVNSQTEKHSSIYALPHVVYELVVSYMEHTHLTSVN